ncbi:MAG: ankyrin repeat domain-containing protein, partial [Desulfobacterales bacterium]|nr:ankyrin repeat domain-containing protein [Desulfobacterales bacterium]
VPREEERTARPVEDPPQHNEATEELIDLMDGLRGYEHWEVARLLDAGADPNVRFDYFELIGIETFNLQDVTPLMVLAYFHAHQSMRLLLEAGADPNARAGSGATALLRAFSDPPAPDADDTDFLAAIELLLEYGADPNLARYLEGGEFTDGMSPMHGAAIAGNIEALQMLINADAEINAQSSTIGYAPNAMGNYPIHEAAINGHAYIVELLIVNGAEVDVYQAGDSHRVWTPRGGHPLHGARTEETVRVLLAHGADPNAIRRDGSSVSALYTMAYEGALGSARLLVEAGAEVNHVSIYGTPLDAAIDQGHIEIAEYLRSIGALTAEELGVEVQEEW